MEQRQNGGRDGGPGRGGEQDLERGAKACLEHGAMAEQTEQGAMVEQAEPGAMAEQGAMAKQVEQGPQWPWQDRPWVQ